MKIDQLRKYLPAGTLSISLILHLAIFLGISGIILIQAVPPKQPFTADVGSSQQSDLPPPPEEPEDTVDIPVTEDTPADENAPNTTSVPIEQIASTAVSSVSFNIAPQVSIPGATGGIGSQPVGTGKPRGGTPRALSSPFGDRNITDGSALTGYMYDLKQTPDRKPSKFAADTSRQDYLDFVKRFVSGGWNHNLLEPFYKVERPIRTFQIFIPKMSANAAPRAFEAENLVQPKRWVILYTGTFVAPDSGTFRFVGLADDVLAVRFNGRTVQDGSLFPASSVRREIIGKPFPIEHQFYQMYAGDWFEMVAGQSYPIEILIGECPGGDFAAFLQIQKKGETYTSPKKGIAPALPVFQTKPCAIPRGGEAPPVTQEQFVGQ